MNLLCPQGMNFIAGYLLIVTKDEEKSFWLMEALLGRILPGGYLYVTFFHVCNRTSTVESLGNSVSHMVSIYLEETSALSNH